MKVERYVGPHYHHFTLDGKALTHGDDLFLYVRPFGKIPAVFCTENEGKDIGWYLVTAFGVVFPIELTELSWD